MAHQVRQTFFSETLIDFLENLGKEKDGQLRKKLLLSANLLKIIYDNFSTEEEFLKAIPYMADIEKGILDDFLTDINLIKNNTDSRSSYYYDKIFLMAMFIAQELLFNLENQKAQHSEKYKHINRAINEVLAGKLNDKPLEIIEEFVDKLDFFQNRRAIEIINYNLQNADFQEFLNYQKNKNQLHQDIKKQFLDLDTKKGEISALITAEKDKANALANYLKGIQSDYNFVGLSKGFQDLLAKKKCSKRILFAGLVIMGIVIILPIYCRIQEGQWTNIVWQEIAFSISLELILIYFFRIILGEYNSIKTQIMQLELRVSLCRFIESYADYVRKINESNSDKNILEKFESVIFSNILADSKDMPSTFDGVEQIGNLIKTLKDK